jgi:hypothetical protein
MNTNEIKTGTIYKLMSENSNKCYIGSTTRKLKERLSQHKHNYKRYLNGGYHYVTSFDIVECGETFIIELERVVGNKKAILARERYYIENTTNAVNKNIAGRTDSEYYTENKEKIREYKQEYYKLNHEKNKEKLLAKNICDICGGKFTTQNKTIHLKTKKHLNKNN